MGELDTGPGDRPQEPEAPRAAAEPATSRALWPTFMRRTLSEDLVRREGRAEARPLQA